jgi:hypothetical protein
MWINISVGIKSKGEIPTLSTLCIWTAMDIDFVLPFGCCRCLRAYGTVSRIYIVFSSPANVIPRESSSKCARKQSSLSIRYFISIDNSLQGEHTLFYAVIVNPRRKVRILYVKLSTISGVSPYSVFFMSPWMFVSTTASS